ncbi:MAG: hypothetical protein K2X87_26560 [Gemmataceae bacterium]|nr:hypothetical protein [Gemmataceae bacterium]
MRRRTVVTALLIFALGLPLAGCGGTDSKGDNPDNLPYSKDGPPQRDGAPAAKRKR